MNDKEKSTNPEEGVVRDKLRMMREAEERNHERIKKWSGEHEQDSNGS